MFALLAGVAPAHAQTVETFDASTTWTAPASVSSVLVEAWGGGGGGGAATGNPDKGGGGAGGQYIRKLVSVTPGASYAVAVGAGGAGGSASNGGTGGDSTFGATLAVAKGGAGGGWAGTNGGDGAAGLGSTAGGVGDVVYRGGHGVAGNTDSNCNTSGAGGGGAGSGGDGGDGSGNTGGTGTATGGGDGGNASNGSANGGSGNPLGGGGAGACAESATDRTGGAGGAGRVVLTYGSGISGSCTTSTVGTEMLVTCTGNGSFTPPTGVSSVRYLVVGGGGGGGGIGTGDEQGGGGGGAGGVRAGTGFAVTPSLTYTITVGGGGTAGTGGSNGGTGGSSTFSTITASGGGGGAREGDINGGAGGSGGGGSGSGTGGAGTAGQGNNGGNGDGAGTQGGAGGGGGAGAAGANGSGTVGGNGGNGVDNDISGTSLTYGGGGGGGGYGAAGGSGGTGGGGGAPATRGAGTAGSANTGGGGGGASGSGSGAAFSGGAGGAGIVMLRFAPPTSTLATGTDPAAATVAPGAAASDVDGFTLQTSSGVEVVTSVTVNLSTNLGVGRLAITDAANNELGFTTAPVAGANTITVSGMSAGTTLTSFKVRVTPLSHAAMPAVPGAAYAITAPVTSWAGTGISHVHLGSDTNANALTIDNASPASATATSGSTATLGVTLNWTTSASADFATTAGSVLYRWAAAAAGSEVPAEGSTPALGSVNGTATVACVVSSPAATALGKSDGSGGSAGECTTAALSSGQAYIYKVFQKDANGNYDAGVTIGPFTVHGAVSAANSTVVASPTSVPADNISTSTITVTLKDSSGTPVPGKSVSLAADFGSSVITVISGTSNASGIATFTVKDGTVEGPITYTATDTTDAIVITQTAQVTFTTPSLCFTDDFNRGTLLETGNWSRTRSTGTTLDAEIVSNRLRLTDAAGTRATAVHLHRLFPGANNKVTAEFTHYAYGGSGGGADGMALTLSDSSIAPVAGAFGGSLGYAQKCQNGVAGCVSDCNVAGGCPGFTGGWIGIGLDEYGNYSNPTEGRVDGPGFQADTVTIRGSGSGQSGYNYHTRVAAPGLDNAGSATPAPGHRYRVIVDHTDGVHAYTSVERDTTGTGTSYATLIPTYDAKGIVTQAAVPPYWFFSFTASTGGATNIHEIDDLTVCTAQPLVVPSLHHLRIVHDGSALTCAAETVTLRACANADCSALYTDSVTVDLDAVTGGAWSADPVTFTSGETQVTLTKGTAGTATLGGSVTAPSSQTAVCYNGATSGDCALVFSSNACTFDAVEQGKNPSTPIFTKLAGRAFNLDVLALNAGAINPAFTGQVTVALVDQTGVAPGSCSSAVLASPTAPTSPYTFVGGDAGRKTFSFNYAQAAKDVRVRIVRVSDGAVACSSDNFAIRPVSFGVSSGNATNTGTSGTPSFKAGEGQFALAATPQNDGAAAVTTGYTGTALINANSHIEAHAGGTAGSVSGVFSAATGGDSGGSAFTYSEVGNFRFKAWGIYDDGSFADVDRSKATPECFSDAKVGTAIDPADPNVLDGNAKFGCYFGGMSASPYFGRFMPHHFDTVVSNACGGFSYSGQPFPLTVTARNLGGATVVNYTGSYAKVATLSDANGAAGAFSPLSVAAASFVSGVADLTAPASVSFKFTNKETAPATLKVRATDADGVNSASGAEGTTPLRSGRLRLINTYGSELLKPRVEYRAEYWDGTRWATNASDTCTALAAGNVAYSGLANPVVTAMSGGIGFITFNVAAAGSYDIALNLNASGSDTSCNAAHGGTAANLPWLQGYWSAPANCGSVAAWAQDPNARIRLGSPRAPYIYLRERY